MPAIVAALSMMGLDIQIKRHPVLPLLLIAILSSGALQPSGIERGKAIVIRSEAELRSRGDLAVAGRL